MANPWRQTELDVIRALKKLKAATAHQIGKEINLTHKWVAVKLRILYAAKRIYISDYSRVSSLGPPREVYSLREEGNEVDVSKPPILGNHRNREYQRRQVLKRRLGLTNQIGANQ